MNIPLWPFNVIKELRKENARLQALVEGDIQLVAAHHDEEVDKLTISSKTIRLVADALVQVFKNTDEADYISLEFYDKDSFDDYEIVVQKRDGETPAQKVRRLEAELQAVAIIRNNQER